MRSMVFVRRVCAAIAVIFNARGVGKAMFACAYGTNKRENAIL